MNAQDQDDLDTWLVEVELAQQKIKELASGKINLEDFDKKEKARQRKKDDDKKKKEDDEEQKRMQEYAKQKEGRSGKGVHNDYLSFCRNCFWEYDLPTPQCLRCQKDTISNEARMEELKGKVEDYKKSKTKREERKKKWELWKKTQAMVWKKSSTNYSKWDYYTTESDSEPENVDPIVPKNDPNFMALEMDIQQRNKKRAQGKIIAEGFKIKGNEAMAKEDYKEAVKMYTSGLDAMKDIKALWTNRALAYIKLKRYSKAIEDCTRILDYCECFEEGYTKSRDSAFKAFVRRSFARKEKKDYRMAKEDILEALKLYPNDKQALDLNQEIQFIVKHKEEALKILEHDQPKYEVLNPQSQQDQQSADNHQNDEEEDADDEEDKQEKLEEQKTEEASKVQSSPLAETSQGLQTNQEIVEKQQKLNSAEVKSDNVVTKENIENKENIESKQNIENKQNVQGDLKSNKSESTEQTEQTEQKTAVVIDRKRSYKKCIDYFMGKSAAEVDDEDMKEVVEHLASSNEAKIYYFEKKGTARLENLLKEKKQCYLLANVFIDDNILYQDQFLKNECHILIQARIQEILSFAEHSPSVNYSEIEDALEVLNTLSIMEKSRTKLASELKTIEFVKNQWDSLVGTYQQEPLATSNYLIFTSNLCYGATSIKKNLITHLTKILNDLNNILQNEKKKAKSENLRENCYNLIANLLTEESVRLAFSQDKYTQLLETIVMRITQYDLVQFPKYIKSAEAALALLVNASFQASPQMQTILNKLCIGLIVIGRFFKLNWRNEQYFEIYNRSLQILAKLDYTDSKLAEKLFELQEMFENEKFASHLIRLYANICTNSSQIPQLKSSKKIDFMSIIKTLKKFIQHDEETKFCNSCNLASFINEFLPELIGEYRDIIPRLITVCRDKTGNLRKNAAIFLAKLAKNGDNLELIRKLHGIEILHSITSFVVQK